MHCSIVFTYYLDCIAIRLALSVYIQLEFRSSYKKFQDRYDLLVTHYRLSVSQVSDGILTSSSYINQVLLPWLKQQIMHWLYLNSRYNTSLSFQMHVFKSLFTGVVYLAWDMVWIHWYRYLWVTRCSIKMWNYRHDFGSCSQFFQSFLRIETICSG